MTEEQKTFSTPLPELAPQIRSIIPGLPEIGKIKIGMKGRMTTSQSGKSFQLPQRIDHFIITTLERGQDGNFLRDGKLHEKLGEKPTVIPIRLLYDDPALNFQSRWACFTGTQLWCTGDGQNAIRKKKDGTRHGRPCPCERAQPDFNADKYRCKPSGVLSVILDDMQLVGGVYKFRTTSYNSVVNIMSSMALIQRITGGILSGIKINMAVRPKTVLIPGSQKTMTVHVVSLEYPGSIKQLTDEGYKMALEGARNQKRIEYIEEEAKRQIAGNLLMSETDTEQDVAEEFYPESVINGEVAPEPEKQNGMYGQDLPPEDRDQGTTIESPPEKTEELTEGQQAVVDINQVLADNGKQPIDPGRLEQFLIATADTYNYSLSEVVEMAAQNLDGFIKAYYRWQVPPEQGTKPQPENKGESTTDIRQSNGYKKYDPEKEEIQTRYSKAKVVKLRDMFAFYKIDVSPKFLETATGAELHAHLLAKLEERKDAGQDEPPADEPPAGEPGEIPFDITNTPEWQRLTELSEIKPDEYRSVMEGRVINTLSDLQQAINLVETKVAEAGFVGGDDGMPEG